MTQTLHSVSLLSQDTTAARLKAGSVTAYRSEKKVGQFGSDIVFLRHASGTLTAHENNCYVAVTEEQEALARSVFKLLPDDEEPEKGYSDPAGVHETGFVIENSASNASTGGPSVAITVYSRKEDLQ